MATAMPSHISPPLRYSGIRPSTVVKVASRMGLKRCRHAVITESCSLRPRSRCSISIRSIRTMALLITIPAREMTPKKGMNPKGSWKDNSPMTTPMMASGIVRQTMTIFRKELN